MKAVQEVFSRHAEKYGQQLRNAPHMVKTYVRMAIKECPQLPMSTDQAESVVKTYLDSVFTAKGTTWGEIDLLTPLFARELMQQISGKPRSHRTGRPKNGMVEIYRQAIQRASAKGLTGLSYCDELTRVGLSTPMEWQKREGCPLRYTDAWNQKKWRQRIANQKSQYTRTSSK